MLSVSEGMKVILPPRGEEMSQRCCSSFSGSLAETSTAPHRQFTPLGARWQFFFFFFSLFPPTAVSQSNLHLQRLCQEHAKLLQNNPRLSRVNVLQLSDNSSEKQKKTGDDVLIKCSQMHFMTHLQEKKINK